MKPIKDCLDYLVKIHDMWSQLSKIPTSRRSTENTVKNQDAITEYLLKEIR